MDDRSAELAAEIQRRQAAEAALVAVRAELAQQVAAHTAELQQSVGALQAEIAQRQWVEQSWREDEERYRSLVELSPDAIIVHRNNHFVYANPAAVQLYGAASADELLRLNLMDFVPADHRDTVAERIRRVEQQSGMGPTVDSRLLRKDGEVRDINATATKITYQGKPSILVILRDVSERKRMEQSLRESESLARAHFAELETLLEAIPAAVFVSHDSGCRHITGNRLAMEMLQTAEGQNVSLSAPPEERPNYRSLRDGVPIPPEQLPMRRAVALGRPVLDDNIEFVRADGTARQVLGNAVPLYNDDGAVRGCVGVFFDITDRKAAEEELKTTQAKLAHLGRLSTMGEMASRIAHEINQPLAAISVLADVAAKQLGGDTPPPVSELRTTLEEIASEACRAGQIVHWIKAFARKEGGRRVPLDLPKILDEVLVLLQDELRRAAVTLERNIAPELPPVLADQVQLQQLLANLLRNACEAIQMGHPTAPRMSITAAIREGMVRVALADNGCGIPPAGAERLCDPFFTSKPEGMGMGLAICRTIIEAHGGRLWAENNDDQGATFYFTLPMAPPGTAT